MSTESTGSRGFTYWRLRFRVWRGARPFWAGLLTLLGGVPIAYVPYAHVTLGHLTLTMATTAGAGSLIIGVLLITLGLTMWFHHIVRVFAGIASILLALVSLPVSNFGGLVVGFLLAMIGGALSISWAPGEPAKPVPTEAPDERPDPDGDAAGPVHPDLSVHPDLRAGQDGSYATDTSVDANGGRNSAG